MLYMEALVSFFAHLNNSFGYTELGVVDTRKKNFKQFVKSLDNIDVCKWNTTI